MLEDTRILWPIQSFIIFYQFENVGSGITWYIISSRVIDSPNKIYSSIILFLVAPDNFHSYGRNWKLTVGRSIIMRTTVDVILMIRTSIVTEILSLTQKLWSIRRLVKILTNNRIINRIVVIFDRLRDAIKNFK